MIVIDASALSKYLLREEGWEHVESYLAKGTYSLDHVVKEVGNAIWKHYAIRKIISLDLALELFKALKRLIDDEVIKIENQDAYIDKAMEIALEHAITLYDALYVAQALRHGELLTCDRKQYEIAKALGIRVYFIE